MKEIGFFILPAEPSQDDLHIYQNFQQKEDMCNLESGPQENLCLREYLTHTVWKMVCHT